MHQRRIYAGAGLLLLVVLSFSIGIPGVLSREPAQIEKSDQRVPALVSLDVVPAARAIYYVSNQGDDANNGSAGAPWATLQHAADMADTVGDVVLVADGEYRGFNSRYDGVIFRANGNNVVVNVAGSYSELDNINVENNNDVVIEGFIVRDAPRAGIRVVNAAGVIVRNNLVGPNGKWGIFSGFAPDIQVLDNVTFGSEEEHGIYLSNSDGPDDNVTVRGNESYGNRVNGIQLNGDCFAGGDGILEGGLIENNIVHDNGAKGLSIISAPGVRIQNNVIYNNRQNGSGAAGIHLVDEPECGKPTTSATVVNNTIVESSMAGIRINDGSTNNIVFNNLIVSENPIADEVGGNNVDDASNIFAASGGDLFLDAASGDYRLKENTPAVDAGAVMYHDTAAPSADIAGKQRDEGSGPDAGAYEFDVASSVSVQDDVLALRGAALEPAFPNPFSTTTRLRFAVARQQFVFIGLYDGAGRLVRVLHEGTVGPGYREVRVESTGLPGGVYFVRMEAAGIIFSRPVVLVK